MVYKECLGCSFEDEDGAVEPCSSCLDEMYNANSEVKELSCFGCKWSDDDKKDNGQYRCLGCTHNSEYEPMHFGRPSVSIAEIKMIDDLCRSHKIACDLDAMMMMKDHEDIVEDLMDEDWREARKCLGKCNDQIKEPELTAGGYPNPLSVHDDLCKAGREIMMKKNHDYTGGSGDPYANFRGSTALGIPNIQGILLRVQDKMMRIKTFEEKGKLKVEGEGIQDALIDVINYMVLIGGLVKEMQNETSEEA